jgi:hypothetical protein
MADLNASTQLSETSIIEILKRWKWNFDPIPEWIILDKDQLRDFSKMQLEFRMKELEIEREKLSALREIMDRR